MDSLFDWGKQSIVNKRDGQRGGQRQCIMNIDTSSYLQHDHNAKNLTQLQQVQYQYRFTQSINALPHKTRQEIQFDTFTKNFYYTNCITAITMVG